MLNQQNPQLLRYPLNGQPEIEDRESFQVGEK